MKPRAAHVVVATAVGAGLLLVFWAYQNPHLAVELANTLWACF